MLVRTFSVSYSDFTAWLEQGMLTCQVKAVTGYDCLGCGMQRAFVLLLKGQVWESIQMYPALIPLIVLIGSLIGHLKFEWNHGAAFIKWNFILVALLMLSNYIFKHII